MKYRINITVGISELAEDGKNSYGYLGSSSSRDIVVQDFPEFGELMKEFHKFCDQWMPK